MYNSIKWFVKSVVPKKILSKYEFIFRKIIALKYLGNNHFCEICTAKLRQFIKLPSNDLLCPACGSLSRTRRLYNLLHNSNALKGNVLHFSPSSCLYRNFKKRDFINYFSSDFADEFKADHHFDITQIPIVDDFFDTIICYHILEHVENDQKAIMELNRVLKPKGKCYIQTPYKDGDLYEDESIVGKAERLRAFGQDDHVRIYSIEGLKKRLETNGFNVSIKTFQPQDDDLYFGLISPETVLICSK